MTLRRRGGLVLMAALVCVLFWLDLNAGYTPLEFADFLALLSGQASASLQLAILDFRLPRIIMAALVGIGLSVSGCILQGTTRNELADPGVLSINAGAGLMVALYIAVFAVGLQNVSFGIVAAAFVGAFASFALVYVLSNEKVNGPPPIRLVLTGVAVATAINALTIMLLLRMRQSEYGFIASWLAGNIWGATWENARVVAPLIVLLLLAAIYRANTLNILALGPQTSTGLGMSYRRESLLLLAVAVGLASACVAVGGGISFVGLICPHLVRRLVGGRHQVLLPATALVGAALMLLADIISRTLIAPSEIPIGVVATIIGTPYFLYLLVNKKRW
jgi:iron complex transport system permease protein